MSRHKPFWPSFSFLQVATSLPFTVHSLQHSRRWHSSTQGVRGWASSLPMLRGACCRRHSIAAFSLIRSRSLSGKGRGVPLYDRSIWFSSFKTHLSSPAKPAVTNLVSSPRPSSSELSSQVAVLPYRSPQLLSSSPPRTLPTGETPLLSSKRVEDLGPNGSDTALFHTFFCNSKWLKQSIHFL